MFFIKQLIDHTLKSYSYVRVQIMIYTRKLLASQRTHKRLLFMMYEQIDIITRHVNSISIISQQPPTVLMILEINLLLQVNLHHIKQKMREVLLGIHRFHFE